MNKSSESTASYNLIHRSTLKTKGGEVRKYYNQNDNTTVWVLQAHYCTESAVFVMKGVV